jgi:hypothetical protein
MGRGKATQEWFDILVKHIWEMKIQDYKKPWVGLTDEEQSFIYDQVKQIVNSKPFWVRFADAIEAKIKEKNT